MTKHTPQAMQEMADWLEAKYRRHGEDEDKISADMLRDLANEAEAEQAIAAGDSTMHNAINYWQERALKAEAAQVSVPAGWKLVPIEPTDEMLNHFSGTNFRNLNPSKMAEEIAAYSRMLAATPSPKGKT